MCHNKQYFDVSDVELLDLTRVQCIKRIILHLPITDLQFKTNGFLHLFSDFCLNSQCSDESILPEDK